MLTTRFHCLCLGLLFALLTRVQAENVEADICVYGGTSGGVMAAVQAAKMGKSVVLLEPGKHLGGLSSGGLGATDIGNKGAIGGLSREFYRRLGKHYGQEEAWKFEPHVAEDLFNEFVTESKARVFKEHRIAQVKKEGARIAEIITENGDVFRARMFIDATYEGDLMAGAKVSYTVGREANSQYGETLNGVRIITPKHQFAVPVDPYMKAGDSTSGLLPYIQSGDGGKPGDGDRSIQAYNFRLCFTTNAANRLPHQEPAGYDSANYELLARYLEALVAAGRTPRLDEFWNPIFMPNGKTDINNNGAFSTDFIGMNYDYADADYATRARIQREHDQYVRGFVYFLATNPRVPEAMRAEMQQWGPCKDEFADNGGWSTQMYVREARRMVSDAVMTELHCRGMDAVTDPVGLAAYNMDSHNCQRIVRNGHVENEGDVQVPPMKPYPISYRAIVPRASECENLLVPVCLSATHIAYGSIRMEPVFMILGQSAATAAAIAIDDKDPLQGINYYKLRARLLADGQVLQWVDKNAAAAPTSTMRSIREFGVSPTQSAQENTRCLQTAIDWAAARGAALWVEPTDEPYPMAGGLVLKRNASLIGAQGPVGRGTRHPAKAQPVGSVFRIEDTGKVFITVEAATQLRGLQFWYPAQTIDDPSKIIAYPPTIQASQTSAAQGVTLSSLTFFGEYLAMDFNTPANAPCEQVLFEHCYGYPLSGQFIRIDHCYDIPRILHCHVNPSNQRFFRGGFSRSVIDAVVKAGTFTYTIDHTDNAQLIDLFTFGVYGGIYLGPATYGQLSNFNLDCVVVGIHKLGDNTKNRNWQIAQGSIIANTGGKLENIHPVIIEGEGHTTLTAVESFSGGNGALSTIEQSQDYLLVRGDRALTVTLTGCRMRNYAAETPITVQNPKAIIQAVGCIDKNEQPYNRLPGLGQK